MLEFGSPGVRRRRSATHLLVFIKETLSKGQCGASSPRGPQLVPHRPATVSEGFTGALLLIFTKETLSKGQSLRIARGISLTIPRDMDFGVLGG